MSILRDLELLLVMCSMIILIISYIYSLIIAVIKEKWIWFIGLLFIPMISVLFAIDKRKEAPVLFKMYVIGLSIGLLWIMLRPLLRPMAGT